jgi:hypothetical protein
LKKKIKHRWKRHAVKGISIASIITLLGALGTLYQQTHNQSVSTTQIWSHVADKQYQINDLDKRVTKLEIEKELEHETNHVTSMKQ